MKSRDTIGEVIRFHMEKKYKTLRSLGKEVGMKHPAVHRISSGTANYTIDNLEKILDGLGLEICIKEKEINK